MRTLICLVSVLLTSTAAAQNRGLTAAQLDGHVLRLQTAGGLQSVRHFELPDPPRVVLDLFGVDVSRAEMPAPAAGSPAIEVRTGEHPNFLRVVVDLTGALPSYQVRRSEGLIEVGLGPAALPSSSTGMLVASSPVPDDPSRPPRSEAPVVAVGREASSAARATPTARTSTAQSIAADVTASDPAASTEASAEELLAQIEAELNQGQSAEELIEQVEAELNTNLREPATNSPSAARAAAAEARRLRRTARPFRARPPADGEERLPFRYVDEEPAKKPPPE